MPCAAIERVVAATADQDVVAAETHQDVGARVARQRVVADAAGGVLDIVRELEDRPACAVIHDCADDVFENEAAIEVAIAGDDAAGEIDVEVAEFALIRDRVVARAARDDVGARIRRDQRGR